jgi:dipeptidyl aminopeptidase/acylaminoacyl peptidase
MKLRDAFLAIFCALLALGISGPNDRRPTDPRSIVSASNPLACPVSIDDLYFTRSLGSPAWSPDGRQITFTTDKTGRLNNWKVSASGGWPVQLTRSNDVQFRAVWSPDSKWIVFQQDHGGNGLYDLYAIPSEGGEAVSLTETANISEEFPHWSPNGKMLAFTSKLKASSAINISLLDWATRRVHPLTHETTRNHIWEIVAWGSDSKTIYANRMEVSWTDGAVYSLDVATGRMKNLTPHQGRVYYEATSISPDGKTLLLTSNQKSGCNNVALLDATTKQLTWVTNTQWQAESREFSPDGKFFTYVLNEDGRKDSYLVDRTTGRTEKFPMPEGLTYPPDDVGASAFAPHGDRLLLYHEGSTTPSDLWVYEIVSHKSFQLTFSAFASLKSAQLPSSEIVHYKTFDGKIISAFLWMPYNLKRDGSNPAVVIAHGGPTDQVVDRWNPDVIALASRGYICIAPNFRGSTGYGIEFEKANLRDLGGGDLHDLVYAVKFLKATGYVNAKKIGITGHSYGGYMTLMALGKTPELWAAGVDMSGISNPLANQVLRSLLGDPVKDRKAYGVASPINYLKNVRAPLLVLHGDNDPVVSLVESEEVVEILRKEGCVVEAHYYPNEGHSLEKREDRIDSIQRRVAWFNHYLKKQ